MPKKWAALTPSMRAEKYRRRALTRRRGSVSITEVKAESVLEAGGVLDTSVLYVLTRRGLRIFHAEQVSGWL
jgi:hypothetical protein